MEKTHIFDRMDDFWLKGSFPDFSYEYYFLAIRIDESYTWVIELDFDEDGTYPKRIWKLWKFYDNLKEGDILHYKLDKPIKKEIIKDFFKEDGEEAKQHFNDWFEEQVYEKVQSLTKSGVFVGKRKET